MSSLRNIAVWKVPEGTVRTATQALWNSLGNQGGNFLMQLNNPNFLKRLNSFVETAGLQSNPAHKYAKEIMGRNMFEIPQVVAHLAINCSNNDLSALAVIPFSKETLEKCRNTHVLIPGFPVSIRTLNAKTGLQPDETLLGHPCAKEKVRLRWYLIEREGRIPCEHKLSIAKDEERVRACELVYAITLYWMITGKSMTSHSCIFECTSEQRHVPIEEWDREHLEIFHDESGAYEGNPPFRIALMMKI